MTETAKQAVVAIVGNERRHRWYLAELAQSPHFELAGAVVETKRPRPQGSSAQESDVLERHFAGRAAAEREVFGEPPPPSDLGAPVLERPFGTTNGDDVADWVLDKDPHLLALFGCSIVREQLLEPLEGRVVNMHLGLSPYYRGAATNLWPLVNGEPECVGATIHLATLAVDGGPILRQARPDIESADDAHLIGCKAIVAGVRAAIAAMPRYGERELEVVEQQPGGRVYRNRDFSAEAVLELWKRLEQGMIGAYLDHKAERDARFPIIE